MPALPTPAQIATRAAAQMPDLVAQLAALVAIPSVATEGFPVEPLLAAHDLVTRLLTDAGAATVRDLIIPGKTAPVVIADFPAPQDAPKVLIYTHYDVVPAGDPDLWETPAFTPTVREGAMYGRGTADSKGNIVAVIGALGCFKGRPPVNVRVVIEGQEEFGSPFDFYPPTDPETFAADAMVIADVGSVRPGSPTLTVALRGSASVTVECTTLAADKHSGLYGGAAPDARVALLHALATLHDANGDVAVPGLRREEWTGTTYTEAEFRALAEVLPDRPLQGTGGIGSRIWSGPAITVIAFDAPPSKAPMNAVASTARAVLNLRVHPQQDAQEAQAALVAHLEALRPLGQRLVVSAGETGNGIAARTDGPAFAAAKRALEQAWGSEVGLMAGGGSIPLVMALDLAVPDAEKLLFGVTDGYANIHGPNERVLLAEIEKGVVAKALLLADYAANAVKGEDR